MTLALDNLPGGQASPSHSGQEGFLGCIVPADIPSELIYLMHEQLPTAIVASMDLDAIEAAATAIVHEEMTEMAAILHQRLKGLIEHALRGNPTFY